MSVTKGFGSGCGGVLGVVASIVLLIVAVKAATGGFTAPCPSCSGSGVCSHCHGKGKGVLWGNCMMCDGRVFCPQCDGNGWVWKR
jgi:hypothetical protein